jgi:hypothetical protein
MIFSEFVKRKNEGILRGSSGRKKYKTLIKKCSADNNNRNEK